MVLSLKRQITQGEKVDQYREQSKEKSDRRNEEIQNKKINL